MTRLDILRHLLWAKESEGGIPLNREELEVAEETLLWMSLWASLNQDTQSLLTSKIKESKSNERR